MSYATRAAATAGNMPIVYVAGALNAPTVREMELNIRRAEDLALGVARLGAAPLVTHPMTRFLHGALSEEYWRAAVMAMLDRCDAMVLTDDYQNSVGTRAEMARAIDLGIPIFISLFGLSCWLKQTWGARNKE